MKKYAAVSSIVCASLVIGGLVVYAECNANQYPTNLSGTSCPNPAHDPPARCTQTGYWADGAYSTVANVLCAATTGGQGCQQSGSYTKVWIKTASDNCMGTSCPADASSGATSDQGETAKYIINQNNCGG